MNSKMNLEARSQELDLVKVLPLKITPQAKETFYELIRMGFYDDLLTKESCNKIATRYSELMVQIANDNKKMVDSNALIIPSGNMRYYTPYSQNVSAKAISILQEGVVAGQTLWGGNSSTPMTQQQKQQLVDGHITSDLDTYNMYKDNPTDKAARRMTSLLAQLKPDKYPRITKLAKEWGLGEATVVNSNLYHFCHIVCANIIAEDCKSDEIREAARYISHMSQKSQLKLDKGGPTYKLLYQRFNVTKIAPTSDGRLIPNYTVTKRKFHIALRLAAGHLTLRHEDLTVEPIIQRVSNVHELAFSTNPVKAMATLINIWNANRNVFTDQDVFNFAGTVKLALNGTNYIPVTGTQGGMKTRAGAADVTDFYIKLMEDGSIEGLNWTLFHSLNDRPIDIYAKENANGNQPPPTGDGSEDNTPPPTEEEQRQYEEKKKQKEKGDKVWLIPKEFPFSDVVFNAGTDKQNKLVSDGFNTIKVAYGKVAKQGKLLTAKEADAYIAKIEAKIMEILAAAQYPTLGFTLKKNPAFKMGTVINDDDYG